MKVMISQPRYLPAMNYIKRIADVNMLIILDNVQRTERGWENRNKVNDKWLTIPIKSSSRAIIKDTEIDGDKWKIDHAFRIQNAYNIKEVTQMYLDYVQQFDYDYSMSLYNGIRYVKNLFSITTPIVFASDLTDTINGGIPNLMDLIQKVNGTVYVSGPTCIEYGLTHDVAKSYGIELEIHDHADKRNFLQYIAEERSLNLQSKQA